ncbi:MAG TPA: hypothetical protein VNQ33_09620, partial [Acidimicrobiales bacterium]|nr:hypothetical protein [Acidimicrobiales bacterium]
AASSKHLQPAISRIEREGGASFHTLEHLLGSLGLRVIAVPLTRPTVADHAIELRQRVAAKKPTIRALAEATNNLVEADPRELPLLVATPPAPTTDARVDAYLAALVDHVCGDTAPHWTDEASRTVTEPWILNPFPADAALDQLIRANTPPAFARHGVYIDASDLASI